VTASIGEVTAAGTSRTRGWLGDSEMARRVSAFSWSSTPLGPIASWPQSLRSAVAICMHSRFQMEIYWGPDLNFIYNDAEREVVGQLHPRALGMPARELMRDAWDVVGPQLEAVMDGGPATWAEDTPLAFDREGTVEVVYFTYSYSPIPRDDGGVGGVLLVTQDTTARVLATRRLDLLRELAIRSMDASTPRQACELAAQSVGGRAELEFILIYLVTPGNQAVCVAASGRSVRPAAAEPVVELDGGGRLADLFRELVGTRPRGRLVEEGLSIAHDSTGAPLPGPVVATAITGSEPVGGFILAGLNNDFVSDRAYRNFVEMLAVGIGRSVAAARAREIERERARSIAELEHAKTALFNKASHELRTPLSLILGPLDQVSDEPDLPAPAREQIGIARRSASRMLKLVNALLDFSRLEAGEPIGTFQPTDLAQLTRDVAAMFRSTAARAGLRLSVDCPPLAETVYVDREAWERIISNLLSNALKFTPVGVIDVRVRHELECVVLTVQDTGIGIAREDLDGIFSRFYRAAGPGARTFEGTGIGLALVRELVHIHGGSIAAQSTPGVGTRMIVRIPLGREHLPAGQLSGESVGGSVGISAGLFVDEARGWFDREDVESTEPSGQIARSQEVVGGHDAPAHGATEHEDRVLLVEDNNDMGDYLRRLLTVDYVVDLASNGLEALKMVGRHRYSVVITDVMMPGMDGFGLLRRLRDDPPTRDLPVILVSARADPESTLEALALGADDYLVKPFSGPELLARVRASLHSTRIRSDDAEARGRANERARAGGELRALLNNLRAAQQRVTAAGDAERQRIERNLHDGAQQRLVAIRIRLGLAGDRIERDPAQARHELELLGAELDEALVELRELAHGLYPGLLDSQGLTAAVSAAARRATIPVQVGRADFGRLPPPVESAAYFCCLEALQNAAKHAGNGARVRIHLEVTGGALRFEVSDTGVGFDRSNMGDGHGLTNLSDRLGALGGEAAVTSIPGQGTTVAGHIPLP
jgi:signal transduction histidine kinase